MLTLNVGSLQEIFQDFYTLTAIHIALIDLEFHELLSYPAERFGFCAKIRSDPEMDKKCCASDKNACKRCAKTRTLVRYTCHAGLEEAVVPIHDGDDLLGYVMFGQILPQEQYGCKKAAMTAQFAQAGITGIEALIAQIPVKSDAQLRAAGTVLQALTAYLLAKRWVTPEKTGFIRRLNQYIAANMDRYIAAEELCAEFRMGRTRLYQVASDYLGCGLAEYIRHRRIDRAKELLAKSGLPITEIAFATGFSDYNHFAKTFKEICGISAREYRTNATA